jgi:anaphase-promoting complex subunit 8
MESEERDGPNMVEAWIYLAKYYKSTKRFEEAEVYCTRLLDYTGPVSQIFNHTFKYQKYKKSVMFGSTN